MNPALRLCAHLASSALSALPLQPDDVLDWYDGPLLAVARCADCDGAALLEFLDWRAGGRERVFAMCAIDAEAVALHARDVRRGSCDLSRAARELEALVASAGPPERLVARAQDGSVCASVPWPAGATLPREDLRERVTRTGTSRWLAAFAPGDRAR